ncbi:alpha/beta-hydrolase [Aspergillus karnatakaensis]|uniref:alpha/beta-hydrolase n=1 Tax=Aspergillus karnatakaensis TaxID=1810916 RepID=UPI003CCCDCD7
MASDSSITILQTDPCRPTGPVDPPSSTLFPAGHVKEPGRRAFLTATHFEHNHVFTLRDGVKLRADVFRPATGAAVPAIVMWSPYGKTGSGPLNLDAAALRVGVSKASQSGYESFEGLDPAEWVPRGYAIVNVDARGAGDSEGDLRWWGSGEGKDGHDFIEEIAAQPWCSGRVALAGNSWLAMAQWFIAAEQPPHLAAIAPLEGAADVLRETQARGGIPAVAFSGLIQSVLPGRQRQEDTAAMLATHPNRNAYWDDKRADFSKIRVPAYILGSYSTNLHTLGAFRAFEEIAHDKKWFATHTSQEWHDLYSKERTEDLCRFFDFYLKDIQNGWERTPPVRLAVLGFNLPHETYSLMRFPWATPSSKPLKLHLNSDQSMTPTAQSQQSNERPILSYQADAPTMNTDNADNELLFTYTFPEKTIVAGPSKAVLTLSAEKQNDLDVYVMLRKMDVHGNVLQNINQPLSDLGVSSAEDVPSVSVLKYLGPEGMLRASRRALAPELSKPWWGTLSHAGDEPVPVGRTIELEIFLWPTGMIFEAGESAVLKVAGHDMRLVDLEPLRGSFQVVNEGKHFVHFGGGYNNFVELNIL